MEERSSSVKWGQAIPLLQTSAGNTSAGARCCSLPRFLHSEESPVDVLYAYRERGTAPFAVFETPKKRVQFTAGGALSHSASNKFIIWNLTHPHPFLQESLIGQDFEDREAQIRAMALDLRHDLGKVRMCIRQDETRATSKGTPRKSGSSVDAWRDDFDV